MPRGGSRRRRGGGGDHESMERWLLTYSDMITLLLALFVILFAISSVNKSKFAELRSDLHSSFNGTSRSVTVSGKAPPVTRSPSPTPTTAPPQNAQNSLATIQAQLV